MLQTEIPLREVTQDKWITKITGTPLKCIPVMLGPLGFSLALVLGVLLIEGVSFSIAARKKKIYFLSV